MFRLLIVAASCLLAGQLASGQSLRFEDTVFPCNRLPQNVRPTSYETHLKFASLDSHEFEGQVSIKIKFVGAKASQDTETRSRADADIAKSLEGTECSVEGKDNRIVLHADESLDIQSIKVRSEAHLGFLFNGAQRDREIAELLRDRSKQMIAIRLKRGSHPGSSGKITISFKGKMRTDRRGIYAGAYKDKLELYRYIVSQFQPTYARTVLPCFDEPRFKVPFSVKLSHPSNLVAYGNSEVKSVEKDESGTLATTTFATTPNMPIHMVAFTVGQFDEPIATVSSYHYNNGTQTVRSVRVITPPGKRAHGHSALNMAKQSLLWFEQYIDFQFPLNKLDIVAIPDLDNDNSESWGLVFVRDNILVVDYDTKPTSEIAAAVNVAHVVVHQWFATLISAAWWQDLWITEGVAAQMAFRIVSDLKNYQSEYFLRLGIMAQVMQQDQAGTSHALSPPLSELSNSDEIHLIFDRLQFMKSGSLCQMLSDALGAAWHQATLRRLVKEHAFGAINQADFIRALTNNGAHDSHGAVEMVRTFAEYKGVPLLDVSSSDNPSDNVQMSLQAFHGARDSLDGATVYPSQDLTIYSTLSVESTPLAVYVHSKRARLNTERFFTPQDNDERYVKMSAYPSLGTYYRVRYTDKLYERLKSAIADRDIGPMARIQLLDDATQLVKAQLISNEIFQALLDSYALEDDPAVILQLLSTAQALAASNKADSMPSPINQVLLNLFKKYRFSFTTSDNFIMQQAREATLTTLIKQGNQEVIQEAVKEFDRLFGDVALFLRQPIYSGVVVSGSSKVKRLFDKLQDTKSREEKIRLVNALSLSRDKTLLHKVRMWLYTCDLQEEIVVKLVKAIS